MVFVSPFYFQAIV